MTRRDDRTQPTTRSRHRSPAVALVVALGVLLSCSLCALTRHWLYAGLHAEFNTLAEDRVDKIQERVNSRLAVLDAISSFYAASHQIGRGEFAVFVKELLARHPEILALQWLPRVPAARRAEYEARLSEEAGVEQGFTEISAQRRLVPAAARADYFPIFYLEPLGVSRASLGYDQASHPVRVRAMAQARDSGLGVATPPIQPLSLAPSDVSHIYLAFLPIYRDGTSRATLPERRKHLRGFVAALVSLERMAQAALAKLPSSDIVLQFHDGAVSGEDRRRYPSPPGAGLSGTRGAVRWWAASPRDAFTRNAEIALAGREITVICEAAPRFFSGREGWVPWALLLAGLLFTNVVAVSFRNAAQRARTEEKVQRQAEELARSNQELRRREEVMHSLLKDLQTAKGHIERQAEALQATNTRLQEVAALKDDFVAKVSHELRTPLTSIKEGLSLMLDNALGETTADQRDFLATMDGDLDRLTELINNMLDLSKIEAGRMRLQRRRMDIRQVVERVVKSYQPLTGRRAIRTEFADAPPVFADANRMVQVLTNLFSNAMKFTPEDGSITFRVDQRNGRVSVMVQDTGSGIAPEDLPKLFQKFSQVGAQTPERPRGTGLGLVVCKELTELHGGSMEVSSQVGQGTAFTVLLPTYTSGFALSESVEEMLAVPREEGDVVGLIAVEAVAWQGTAGAQGPSDRYEELAEEIRRRVHRGDSVLPLDPPWIAIVAVAPPEGFRLMIERLRHTLPGAERLRFGVAFLSDDVTEAAALFAGAAHALDQDAPCAALGRRVA